MPRLEWDQTGEKTYEAGVSKGVLYPQSADGTYPKGTVWNGLTAINESSEGGEPTAFYADNIKYLNILSTESAKATIESYTYPKEFESCDGSAEVAPGVTIGQQKRTSFGMCYRTELGNDVEGEGYGYKLHLFWGGLASPSERNRETINDSPDILKFSWEVSMTPISVAGFKPTATMEINSKTIDSAKMKALEDVLYGTESAEARLPLPDEIVELIKN